MTNIDFFLNPDKTFFRICYFPYIIKKQMGISNSVTTPAKYFQSIDLINNITFACRVLSNIINE